MFGSASVWLPTRRLRVDGDLTRCNQSGSGTLIDGTDEVGTGLVGFAGLDWSVSGTGNFDGR